MTTKRKPTALQIYKQRGRIQEMERKLYDEKRKLDAMVKEAGYINEKINVGGIVYHIRTEIRSWHCNVHVERLGTVEEFLLLAK